MNESMLEILISKYLDSEITPAEQKLLDEELQNNPDARQLLSELEQLQSLSQEFVQDEVVETGRSADDIIEQALAVARKPRVKTPLGYRPWYQDPISLAASFLLAMGLVSMWATMVQQPRVSGPANQDMVAQSPLNGTPGSAVQGSADATSHERRMIRLGDPQPEGVNPSGQSGQWSQVYVIVDAQGNRWIVRQAPRQPADATTDTVSYEEGL